MSDQQTETLKAELAHHSQVLLDQQRRDWEKWFEEWRQIHESGLQMLSGVFQFAIVTIRSLLLINGGAIVVLIALLGSIWAGDKEVGAALANRIAEPGGWFVTGLLVAVLTSALSYLAQVLFVESPVKQKDEDNKPRMMEWGARLRIAAIILGLVSMGAFAAGAFKTLQVFAA